MLLLLWSPHPSPPHSPGWDLPPPRPTHPQFPPPSKHGVLPPVSHRDHRHQRQVWQAVLDRTWVFIDCDLFQIAREKSVLPKHQGEYLNSEYRVIIPGNNTALFNCSKLIHCYNILLIRLLRNNQSQRPWAEWRAVFLKYEMQFNWEKMLMNSLFYC